MSAKVKFWIVGLVLAATGVVMAKLIAPGFPDHPGLQIGLFAGGVLIAMAGLGMIMVGARKQ